MHDFLINTEELNSHSSPSLIIVIPAFNEKDPLMVLNSLNACLIPESISIAVLYIFNASENASTTIKSCNLEGFNLVKDWQEKNEKKSLIVIPFLFNGLPEKDAGVGLARKIGMDVSCNFFYEKNNPGGLITCLDADCTVSENYICELLNWQKSRNKMDGCSISFEHPLPVDLNLRSAIIYYELHLRYYINAQAWAGLPYAFQTIGSSMAVRATAYRQCGGMNKRKAGEDFYFLQKIIKRGRFENLSSCTVFPSARISDRVPFGTGRAVSEFLATGRYSKTYNIESFEIVKAISDSIMVFFKSGSNNCLNLINSWNPLFHTFFQSQGGIEKLEEVMSNARTATSRIQRFYHWFDAFMLMKWCHFAREQGIEDIDTCISANYLLKKLSRAGASENNPESLLRSFRNLDRDHKAGIPV